MPPLFTASEAPLLFRCIGPACLPRIHRESAAATKGTERHAELEHDEEQTRQILVRAGLPIPAQMEREVYVRYDIDEAKAAVIVDRGTRQATYAALTERQIGMRTDLAGMLPTAALVVDFKNGSPDFVEPARTNKQLAIMALAVARSLGFSAAKVALVYLRDQEREWADVADLDAMDLDLFELELIDLCARIEEGRRLVSLGKIPTLSPDPETCRFCDCAPYCPAITMQIRAVVSDSPPDYPSLAARVEQLLPDQAAEALALVEDAEARFAPVLKLKGLLYGYARNNPIVRRDGTVLAEVQTVQERVTSAEAAHAVLANRYGAQVANVACPRESSWTAIDEATKHVRVRGEKEALKRELRQAGALAKVAQAPKVEAVRPDDRRLVNPQAVAEAIAEHAGRGLPSHATATEGNE